MRHCAHVCSLFDLSTLTAAILHSKEHNVIVVILDEPKTPKDFIESAAIAFDSMGLHMSRIKFPSELYALRDYYAESLQGLVDLRAWLALRVRIFLKNCRTFQTIARQPCWSCDRWKSLT